MLLVDLPIEAIIQRPDRGGRERSSATSSARGCGAG